MARQVKNIGQLNSFFRRTNILSSQTDLKFINIHEIIVCRDASIFPFYFATSEVLCHATSLPIAFAEYIIKHLFHETLHSITFGK